MPGEPSFNTVAIALLSALGTLYLKKLFDDWNTNRQKRSTTQLVLTHLKALRKSLLEVLPDGEYKVGAGAGNDGVRYGLDRIDTMSTGLYLHDILLEKLHLFKDVNELANTVEFFHSYKWMMAKMKNEALQEIRKNGEDGIPKGFESGSSTTKERKHFYERLNASIAELEQICS